MTSAWKLRSRITRLHQSKWLTVEQHEVELPNGQVIPDWMWIVTPDFVNVAALTRERNFLVFRQFKYAVGGESLAPCGGYMEPGEDPLLAAKRELREETGYAAARWTFLGRFAVDGNRGSGNAHLFLAEDAERVAEINRDDLEDMQLLEMPVADVRAALVAGDFRVTSWSQVMALALLAIDH